jgi:Tol biopolymer transport system component
VQEADGRAFGRVNLFTIPVAGGPDVQLTDHGKPDDGPEFSPDGEWIYFNSEMGSAAPGHMQLFRMRPDGGEVTQLTDDERVNWFPHVSPDGAELVYLSYAPGVVGHPADKDVTLRRMAPDGGPSEDLLRLFGGQGTVNVNSWAPDSSRFAFVEYPVGAAR